MTKGVKQLCPACGSGSTAIVKTDRRLNNIRWRRHHCRNCGNRWSTHFKSEVSFAECSTYGTRQLSTAQAVEVLTSPLSARALARHYGIRHTTILNIRAGRTYKDAYQQVNPSGEVSESCSLCSHWSAGCTFQFPEAGGTFAADCIVYDPK